MTMFMDIWRLDLEKEENEGCNDLCYVYKLYIDAYLAVYKNSHISKKDIEIIEFLTVKILDIIGGSYDKT